MEYKDTIFLPKTSFEMRANLPQKEPKILEVWDKEQIFKINSPILFNNKNNFSGNYSATILEDFRILINPDNFKHSRKIEF